jgi:BolA protein
MPDQAEGSVKKRIREKLERALAPTALEVVDESHLHAGHSGARPQGETHFRVEVASAAFIGKGRLDRHRMVNSLLSEELASGVHALAISAKTPDEA